MRQQETLQCPKLRQNAVHIDIDVPSNAPFGDRVAGSMTSTLGIDNRPCLWTGGVPTAPCLDAAVFKNQAVVNVTVDVLLSVFVADGAL